MWCFARAALANSSRPCHSLGLGGSDNQPACPAPGDTCSRSPGVKPDVDKIILSVLEGRREVVLESGIDSSLRVDSMLVLATSNTLQQPEEVARPGVGVLGGAPRLAKDSPTRRGSRHWEWGWGTPSELGQ